jgi:hypothetical protein
MNEQLIKIGLESGMLNYVDNETPRHYFLSGHADEQDLEKFAELIVQECALTVAMFSINKNDIHPDIKWVDMTESAKLVNHTTCQHVAEKIKEHFGVKE